MSSFVLQTRFGPIYGEEKDGMFSTTIHHATTATNIVRTKLEDFIEAVKEVRE